MRITRHQNRTVISCSDHEFQILQHAVKDVTMENLPESGLRRSFARRTNKGQKDLLRIDYDKRTPY